MARTMGMDFGLPRPDGTSQACKKRNRWLFNIDQVCGGAGGSGTFALPPSVGARPSLSFREMEIKHLNETVYRPARPEWKPVRLILYDLKKSQHPVFEWIRNVYDPQAGTWAPSLAGNFLKTASLNLFDGCGNIIETWIYEGAWPQMAEFGELDMGSVELVTCEITLRYDRGYIYYG